VPKVLRAEALNAAVAERVVEEPQVEAAVSAVAEVAEQQPRRHRHRDGPTEGSC
jgi:hypothetical protein